MQLARLFTAHGQIWRNHKTERPPLWKSDTLAKSVQSTPEGNMEKEAG